MADLDKELKGIAHRIMALDAKSDYDYYLPEYIGLIKQAFADAGYVNLSDRGGLIHTTVVDSRGKTEYMTGQEWYDRYVYEKGQGSLDNLKDMPHSQDYSDGIDHAVIKCDEAAMRAAGLK